MRDAMSIAPIPNPLPSAPDSLVILFGNETYQIEAEPPNWVRIIVSDVNDMTERRAILSLHWEAANALGQAISEGLQALAQINADEVPL